MSAIDLAQAALACQCIAVEEGLFSKRFLARFHATWRANWQRIQWSKVIVMADFWSKCLLPEPFSPLFLLWYGGARWQWMELWPYFPWARA